MNEFEREHLPQAYRPLSAWAYLGLTLLYLVPVVGWVFLILHAVSRKNINRRNHARGMLLFYAAAAILAVLVWLFGYVYYSPVFYGVMD